LGARALRPLVILRAPGPGRAGVVLLDVFLRTLTPHEDLTTAGVCP
jgi:hypothetical protein